MNNFIQYDDFKKYFKAEIDKAIEQSDGKLKLIQDTSESADKDSLILRFGVNNLCSRVKMENMYEYYNNHNESLEQMVSGVIEQLEEIVNKNKFDIEQLTPEYIMSHLEYRAMNLQTNQLIAETCPHKNIAGDVMLVPYIGIKMSDDLDGDAGIRFTKDLQQYFKMTEQEVHSIAMKNLNQKEFVTKTMVEVLFGNIKDMPLEMKDILNTEDISSGMYVVTSESQTLGANVLGSVKALKQIGENVKEDEYFIIPSSIHEILVFPSSIVHDPAELQSMCESVNADSTLIRKEEVLSNNIYRFDGQKLRVCNSIEELQEQKESQQQEQTMTFHVKRGM